jgi:DNA (cytosine-5)-methyltransferase 1
MPSRVDWREVKALVRYAGLLRNDRKWSERPTMLQNQGYVTVKEAAELLDVSPNTVRAWGAAGRIPEYRHPVNKYRLYRRADLESINRQVTGGKRRRQR